MNDKKGRLLVISGSSGSGKGTVLSQLTNMSDRFCYSVSATTRAPRAGEIDGKNYFFVTRERFEEMIKNGQMLEYAEYVGNLYGTPKQFVIDQLEIGMNVILEIEVCGAMQIKKKFPEAILIFIAPPNYSVLSERLHGRATELDEVIHKRLGVALEEIKAAIEYDYIVLNRDNEAVTAAKTIIDIAGNNHPGEEQTKEYKTEFINKFLIENN